MFLYDKYSPKTIYDLEFHTDIVKKLYQISSNDALPHIILYGPDGAGKETIARMFLEKIYDPSVSILSEIVYNVNGSGNTTADILIKQSPYHIIIEPNNNNFDRYLIQDIVKKYAQQLPMDVFATSKTFKVVLINNADNLSYYAQMSLRRTMEKYSKTCRFLMICNSYSKLFDPLRSRCVCIRVPSPTRVDIMRTVMKISNREKYKLSLNNLCDILTNSNGNIKHAIWLLEFIMRGIAPSSSYTITIKKIIDLVIECDIRKIAIIRNLMYGILITNITGNTIINTITSTLCGKDNITDDVKIQIIKTAAKYESNITIGRREMIHLDGFIMDIILILS